MQLIAYTQDCIPHCGNNIYTVTLFRKVEILVQICECSNSANIRSASYVSCTTSHSARPLKETPPQTNYYL